MWTITILQRFSDLKGHVLLKGGTATLTDLSFRIPGAFAQMYGTL
jgi:hypothetical protein